MLARFDESFKLQNNKTLEDFVSKMPIKNFPFNQIGNLFDPINKVSFSLPDKKLGNCILELDKKGYGTLIVSWTGYTLKKDGTFEIIGVDIEGFEVRNGNYVISNFKTDIGYFYNASFETHKKQFNEISAFTRTVMRKIAMSKSLDDAYKIASSAALSTKGKGWHGKWDII